MASADIILTGTVEEIVQHSEYDEYNIKVNNVKKGDVKDTLKVRNYLYNYSCEYQDESYSGKTNTGYEIGKEYYFVLQHIYNVYEDKYMIMSDIFIPVEKKGKATVLSRAIDEDDNLRALIDGENFQKKKGAGDDLSIDYIKSDDRASIVKKSPYIAEVQLKELYQSAGAVDLYLCDVQDELKGRLNTEKNQVLIPFFANTVQLGETYIVLLSDSDEEEKGNSSLYVLSSKDSVWSVNQKESINKEKEK